MNSLRVPLTVLAVLGVVFIGELLYFYPLLPETVASHFDMDGVPNGWMSRTAYVIIMLSIMIISAATTVGVALLLPKMEGAINIPNRAYWLAPERREETLGLIGASLVWTECAVMALFAVITYGVSLMNIEGRKTFDWPMIPTLIVFLAFVTLVMARMLRRFRKPTETSSV
jgi:uncharacterized membrane protein